jgi:hypothetical protein
MPRGIRPWASLIFDRADTHDPHRAVVKLEPQHNDVRQLFGNPRSLCDV